MVETTDREHRGFMSRALDLARIAEGNTSPNPGVGAVVVCRGRILGEGFHSAYGQAHAEVEAIRSVSTEDRHLLPESILYVTLEPCCVHGRTPPCTDLILNERIPVVVVSCRDRSPGIDGRGLAILRDHGVRVIENVLSEEGRYQNAIRNTFVSKGRPYVILKMAMSRDGFIGRSTGQVILSNPPAWRLVHRLRQRVDALMVGTRTVEIDDPQLTNRLFWGSSPVRIILDRHGRLDHHPSVFNDQARTWIFRSTPSGLTRPEHIREFIQEDPEDLGQILQRLAQEGITSLLVEGGATLFKAFLEARLWDEAIISSTNTYLGNGIRFPGGLSQCEDTFRLGSNHFDWFRAPDRP